MSARSLPVKFRALAVRIYAGTRSVGRRPASGPRTSRPEASTSARMHDSLMTLTEASACSTGWPSRGSIRWEKDLPVDLVEIAVVARGCHRPLTQADDALDGPGQREGPFDGNAPVDTLRVETRRPDFAADLHHEVAEPRRLEEIRHPVHRIAFRDSREIALEPVDVLGQSSARLVEPQVPEADPHERPFDGVIGRRAPWPRFGAEAPEPNEGRYRHVERPIGELRDSQRLSYHRERLFR